MQEDIDNKTIGIAFKASKITGEVLLNVVKAFFKKRTKKGKQSMKKLSNQGLKLTSLEINTSDFREFGKAAKSCALDFSVMKGTENNYVVFFKVRDADQMDLALKKLAKKKLHTKESLADRIKKAKETIYQREHERESPNKEKKQRRNKEREGVL